MKGWKSLFGEKPSEEKEKKTTTKKASKPKQGKRGCEFCPLNNVIGIHKVKNLDKVVGKRIMVWAQNPGYEENRKRLELIGPAGKLLWREAKRVGLNREDCDIQNVVRCWTATRNEFDVLEGREPAKEELRCCSIYTEEALERNHQKAKVHLVLGKVAARALLKGEFRKDWKTFYSEKLQAWVVLTYHPSYFLRGAPKSKLKEFREALEVTVSKAGQKRGKFSYIESQDYKDVQAKNLKSEFLVPIVQASKAGERIVFDIEDDWIEVEGKKVNVIVAVGASWKKGMARILVLNHPGLKQSRAAVRKKIKALKWVLENLKIKKAFQYGSYDVDKLRNLLDIRTRGYDHDTQYSEYLRFSGRRAFGLEAIADVRFREFAGYKGILDEWRDPETQWVSFLKIPLRTLVLYNGADCDLTKRIEKDNSKKVNHGLLQVFIKAASPLSRMEGNGPLYDAEYDKVLVEWIPKKVESLRKQLQEIAGDPKFNPASPPQVAKIVYDKLRLDRYLDESWKKDHKRSTGKDTMTLIGMYHKLPDLLTEFRQMDKKKNTYLDGYRKSAQLHGGRLRTMWMLTGTVTGRLRSGGGKDKKKGLVNLQNIHGSPTIENLLVSDLRWREVYDYWRKREFAK